MAKLTVSDYRLCAAKVYGEGYAQPSRQDMAMARAIEFRVRELVATEVEDWGAATKTGVAQIAYSIRNLDVQPERTSA